MSNALLEAAAALDVGAAGDGPERHRRLSSLFRALGGAPEDRPEAPSRKPPTDAELPLPRMAEKAAALAHIWKKMGMAVVACRFPAGHPLEMCPKFVFALGFPPDPRFILSAAFNSRKGKLTRRADPWVRALRRVFTQTGQEPVAWVGSFKTALYDLVTCWAHLHGKPTVVIGLPSPSRSAWDEFRAFFPDLQPHWFFSCLPGRAACPPKQNLLCRDRLVAAAADRLYVIEIRRGGNLMDVLSKELASRPRLFWVFPARAGAPETEGNAAIEETFPRLARIWSAGPGEHDRPCERPYGSSRPERGAVLGMPPLEDPFLFHYTRSCPGPWPGQARCDWADDLFQGHPWADHTALDTLWRILSERRLRASGRLIRGGIPVVSWTPVPPQELTRIIRWNPALIRWTFEPYGIAVKRRVLKNLGARPVIYIREEDFPKIAQRERFRFQLHEVGKPTWKREREWRLAGDLDLDALDGNDWWAFVPTPDEACRLQNHVHRQCRIISLQADPF